MNGAGTLSTTGTVTIQATTAPVLDLGGGVTWLNAGMVNDVGLGGLTGAAIVNKAGATFDVVGDGVSLTEDATPGNLFTNAGLLAKTSGNGLSTIGVSLVSTGVINVASGTLELTGGGTIGGAVNGAGTLLLGAGTFSVAATTGNGHIAFGTGEAITFAKTAGVAAPLTLDGGVAVTVAAGVNATLSGAITVGDATSGAVLSGPGTLTTTGVTTISDTGVHAVDVGGGVTWANTGTVNDSGIGYFGTAGTNGDPGTVLNKVGGTFNLAGDDASMTANPASSNVQGFFTNAGTLAKTGGTKTSTIQAVVTSTGTVAVASGTLALTGGGGVSGVLTGAGTLGLGGGAFTGTGLSGAGHLAITGGASLTTTGPMATALFVAGNSALAAAGQASVTVSGAISLGDQMGAGLLTGPGTLTTTGITTAADTGLSALVVQGGVTWANGGTVNDFGIGYFGASGVNGDTGSLVNQAGASFDFAGDDASLTYNPANSNTSALLSNAGTLAKTGGTGVSTVAVSVANTGTIEAASGTFLLAAGVTGTGTLKIDAGATLDVGATANTQSIVFAGGHGATLRFDVAASQTLTGLSGGDRLILAGTTVSAAKITGGTLTVTAASGTYSFTSAALAGLTAGFGTNANGEGFVTIDRSAVATHTPEPLAFGNRHVGDIAKLSLTVGNVATADGYSEKLNAALATASPGFTAAGTVAALVAGGSNATALTATMSTATVDAKAGTATLTVASNGAGVDGRGDRTNTCKRSPCPPQPPERSPKPSC